MHVPWVLCLLIRHATGGSSLRAGRSAVIPVLSLDVDTGARGRPGLNNVTDYSCTVLFTDNVPRCRSAGGESDYRGVGLGDERTVGICSCGGADGSFVVGT